MKLRSLLTVLAFVLLFSSCSKDFEASSNFIGPKLSRILIGTNVIQEFTYDEKGRLIKYTSYFGQTFRSSESKRYYDNSGKLIKIENAINVSSSTIREQMDSSYSEMNYIGNRLVETKTYRIARGSIIYASRAVPDYDADGRTIAVTLYDATNNLAYAKSTYQYNAQNNIIASEYFQYNAGIQGPSFRSTYEYDNQQNPLKDIWIMPYGANINNITKQVTTNYIAVPANPSTSTDLTVFKTYNSNGYPTLVNENGVDYVYEYN